MIIAGRDCFAATRLRFADVLLPTACAVGYTSTAATRLCSVLFILTAMQKTLLTPLALVIKSPPIKQGCPLARASQRPNRAQIVS
jgi:hypothetical protein